MADLTGPAGGGPGVPARYVPQSMLRTLSIPLLFLASPCWAPIRGTPEDCRPPSAPVTSQPEEDWPEATPDTYHGVPGWVIRGILARETRSTLDARAVVTYRDRRVGLHGELGCMQMKPGTVTFVARLLREPDPGSRVHRDTALAVRYSARYLEWLRARAGSWDQAVRQYNAGPSGGWRGGDATKYLGAVRHLGETVPIR